MDNKCIPEDCGDGEGNANFEGFQEVEGKSNSEDHIGEDDAGSCKWCDVVEGESSSKDIVDVGNIEYCLGMDGEGSGDCCAAVEDKDSCAGFCGMEDEGNSANK